MSVNLVQYPYPELIPNSNMYAYNPLGNRLSGSINFLQILNTKQQ